MLYIHLKKYHTACARFYHPLLKDSVAYTEDELNKIAENVLAGGDPDELILALLNRLSALIAVYRANWPACIPYTDDMVSEGFATITKLCHNIPEELFAERSIPYIMASRCQRDIERMLNSMRSLAAPSASTQFDLIRRGKAPIYFQSCGQICEDDEAEELEEYAEETHPTAHNDISYRDIFDAVCKIEASDEIDEFLLDDENWGKNNVELAAELGITTSAVRYRREKLYKKFLEITE